MADLAQGASSPDQVAIADAIVRHVLEAHPSDYVFETLPRTVSLIEIGILDSYGVIELVEFLEETWQMTIADDDLTKEKMGSIVKMAALVHFKRGAAGAR